MGLTDLAAGGALDVARGDTVVCVPLYGGHDHFRRCLRSLLEHTPTDVPILIADDCTPEPASRAFVDDLEQRGVLSHAVVWMRAEQNSGFVGNVNSAFAASAPADVIIVNSDVTVAENWFEGMREAARSDTTVATATALTNHGTIVSVPRRNQPIPDLPQDVTLERAAADVWRTSERLRPRLPVAIGHCLYVKRAALELVGDFDLAFAPGYGEEVDHAQRLLAAGMQHVVADDVLVLHHGSGSFERMEGRSALQCAHDAIIDSRYGYYDEVVSHVAAEVSSPLARALGTASRAIRGMTVTIDGRSLGSVLTGTQIHTLEVVAALARTGGARIRVLLPEHPGDYVGSALGGLSNVELLAYGAAWGTTTDDVVHRPWQIQSVADFELLDALGTRRVITQQDFIAYRNPSYFPSAEAWLHYRSLAEQALASCAVVIFFSEHARREALLEDLVPEERTRVVLLGTDHTVALPSQQPVPPREQLGDRPFLLCLGTDFQHKNRVFAIRLFDALRRRHGWQGRLVLAGPRVSMGSSSAEEAELLAADPELARDVVILPAVTDPEKSWLMSRCAAVVYPTTYEGFGLVPFEAADHDRPCLFARQSSLAELFGPDDALLVPWNAEDSADAAIAVLTDDQAAQAQVERVRARAQALRWETTAQGLLEAYDTALHLPARSALRRADKDLHRDSRYWALREQIGPTGMSLVGPSDAGGPLLGLREQRALAALARRPATRASVLGVLRALSRLGGRGSSLPALPTPSDPGA